MVGGWLELMIVEVFSSLNNSVITSEMLNGQRFGKPLLPLPQTFHMTMGKFFHLGLALSFLSYQWLCFLGFPLCAGLCFPSRTFSIEMWSYFFFIIIFGPTSISPWIHKPTARRLKSYGTFLCSLLPTVPLHSVGVACCAPFLTPGVWFMSPCTSQSLRLWRCFRNKSFYFPVVVFNYSFLDGDIWKHKQEGFQQFSQCPNVWTTLCASHSTPLHLSNICLPLSSSTALLSAKCSILMVSSAECFWAGKDAAEQEQTAHTECSGFG